MNVLGKRLAPAWVVMLAIFGTGNVRAGDNVWTSLGPEGGPAIALAIDPQNPRTVYAANGAGLFKSTDEGAAWSAVKPGPPCCVLTLLIDAQTPTTIYAVTRVAGPSRDHRVLKSTDGGTNWSPVNSGLPVDAGGLYGVTSLAIDPRNPTTVYAGNVLIGGGGVFKTTNGGESWNAVNSGLPDGGIMALAIDASLGTIYASTQVGGLFQSTDGGASWSAVNSGLPDDFTRGYDYVSILAIDPLNPGTVYAAGHFTPGSTVYDDISYDGLFKTADAGASWSPVNRFSNAPGIVIAMAIDPRNPGTVYAGTTTGISKSTDGGTSWSNIKSRLPTDAYGSLFVSALAIDSSNPDTVYAAGANAGVFKTTDAGASWAEVNSELRVTTPTGLIALRVDPQNPGTIYAATDTGLFKNTDAGANWTAVNAGLPTGYSGQLTVSALTIDPQNPSSLYALDPWVQDVFKSTDGGASWTGALPLDAAGLIVRGARLTATALAIDPRNASTLYAAGSFAQNGQQGDQKGVLKSTDGGAHWSAVSSGLPVSPDQSVIASSLAVDPQNPGTVYAGIRIQGLALSRDSLIFKTTNGGASWRSAGLSGFTRVDILAIDPRNPSTIYVRAVDRIRCSPQRLPVPGGFDGCGWLYKTVNGGTSWNLLNSGLPNYVTDLAIDPQNSSTLYAGSGSGVFRSTDGGASWNAVNSGLTTLSVSTVAIGPKDSNTVYAGVADGGVFTITFDPGRP